MTEITHAPIVTPDAARAADESVIAGVGTSPARPGRPAAKRPTKAARERAAAAIAAGEAAAKAAKAAKAATGAARYGENYAPPRAMVAFTEYLFATYPGLFPTTYAKLSASERVRYERIVSAASKAYGYFQSSTYNR